MPTTLTDDPTSFPNVTAPASTDARGYVSVQTPLQQLSNRTRQNKNRIDLIAPSTDGVRLLRHVASDAALLAITAPDASDGQFCVVDDVGLYQFNAVSVVAALAPFVRTPTFVGGGAGRWHLVAAGNGTLNVANGIPQCDSAGRVPAASVRNGLVAVGHVECGIFNTNTVSPSWADVSGASMTLTALAVGDIVMVDYSSDYLVPAASVLDTRVAIVRPDTTTVQPTNAEAGASGGASVTGGLVQLVSTYVVTQNGTHTVKIQANSNSSSDTVSLLNLNARVLVFRP